MIVRSKQYLFAFLLVTLATISVFTQGSPDAIRGIVVDSNGALVSGADITVSNKGSGQTYYVLSDNTGAFTVANLPSGSYRVAVVSNGFSTLVREVKIPGDLNNQLEFRLSIGNISEIVTVTATRTQVSTNETAVPISVLTREKLEQKNLNTIGDVFRDLPGTSTANEGAFQVRPRIRGLDSNRVLVLVDGERLNNARTSTSQSGIETGLVELDQIETVEVVRGSGSVLYGTDALAGTVNIITRDTPRRTDGGFRFGATFNGFYSSNDSGRRGSLAVNGSSKWFAFRVSQSLERYGNYFSGNPKGDQIDGVNPDGEVLNSQSHGGNTQFTTRFFFNENSNLKLNYERRRASNIGSPSLVGVFNAFFPFSIRDKFSGRYEITNLNKYFARISASAYYQKQDRDFTNILNVPAAPPFFPGEFQFSQTKTKTNSSGFDLQTNWLFGTRNFLTAGASFFRDTNNDTRFLEILTGNYTVFPPVLVRSVDFSPSVPDSKFGSFAVFAQDQFQVSRKLSLIGGVRAERFSSSSKRTDGFAIPAIVSQTLTPAQIESLGLTGLNDGVDVSQATATGDFGIVYKLTDDVSLTGKIGRSFRVPNLFERFFTGAGSIGGFVVANPNLKPESGINIDTSVKVSNAKFAGSITYFNNNYKNFLSSIQLFDENGQPFLNNLGGLYQTQNISRARIQGVEADFEAPIKFGSGFLTPSGNFTYLRGDNLDTNQPLNTISPVKTVLSLRWQDTPNTYFGEFQTRIVNKQKRLSPSFFASNGGAEPGFAVSEIRGGYNFKREKYSLRLNLGITNLFDRYYNEQFVFAPARGRAFVIGTSWELF
jgi:hemoglobin/transferrin/lactoferrin receptor protein